MRIEIDKGIIDPNQLHDELMILPGSTETDSMGQRIAILGLQYTNDKILIDFSDTMKEEDILSIIQAHSPKPRQDKHKDVMQKIKDADTLEKLKEAILEEIMNG